jgi:CRP-like cAMP-binding protein
METATLPAGTPLVEEGEEGDAFFVIIDGTASVQKGGHQLGDVGPGASFGELALLDGEPRSASVIATDDVSVAVLGVRMFRTLLREFPEMAIQLMAGLAGDLRQARDELAEATRDRTA